MANRTELLTREPQSRFDHCGVKADSLIEKGFKNRLGLSNGAPSLGQHNQGNRPPNANSEGGGAVAGRPIIENRFGVRQRPAEREDMSLPEPQIP